MIALICDWNSEQRAYSFVVALTIWFAVIWACSCEISSSIIISGSLTPIFRNQFWKTLSFSWRSEIPSDGLNFGVIFSIDSIDPFFGLVLQIHFHKSRSLIESMRSSVCFAVNDVRNGSFWRVVSPGPFFGQSGRSTRQRLKMTSSLKLRFWSF